MRLPVAALAAFLAAGAGAAYAQSQPAQLTPGSSQDESVIAVPPAPAIVASPPSPALPPVAATPAPPGLVPANPPAVSDTGNVDNGNADSGNADSGNVDNGSPQTAGTSGATAPGQSDAAQAQSQDAIPTPPNTWQPGKTAEIGVLDKIGGGVKEISVPVGGQSVVGDLQVNVLACVIRPPDQVPDAAAFLSLQNTGDLSGPPAYRGWLIRSAPGAAIAGDASEVFRVIDCS